MAVCKTVGWSRLPETAFGLSWITDAGAAELVDLGLPGYGGRLGVEHA
jgi:hypothetical protein